MNITIIIIIIIKYILSNVISTKYSRILFITRTLNSNIFFQKESSLKLKYRAEFLIEKIALISKLYNEKFEHSENFKLWKELFSYDRKFHYTNLQSLTF